jgi:hypothetical protein
MYHVHQETVRRQGCTGRTRITASDTSPQVRVTLSEDLLSHLRKVAQQRHIPLRWLVAGLVCDTFETGIERSVEDQVAVTAS